MSCVVLKQRIRKHLLNASRHRHSSDDDDELTLDFVQDIDAVSVVTLPVASCICVLIKRN